ncbi:MAG: CDP-glycerol glycerophosphotransferase family protein [Lachnospiraceae bacterium]|nr:CDP-glycerol glycerophosphotransferase family protein [Lachnospiraceae bacterium]
MRRHQKRMLMELVATLDEAHAQIGQELKNKNTDTALSLLGQCQECAVTIGETIEASEGEGHETVTLLEHYCEKLYNISQDIESGTANPSKLAKLFTKAITTIRSSIANDIHETIETIFLPYKASMWDSLESVWKKADADPDCDAYVIPIPYFDRNPDGSAREEHYEGGDYPTYVPITSYTEYDFEGRHPDRIYIHNPYDEGNYVTSVHPFFYSRNLKNFTDELIYIPYFVLADPDPENEAQLEGISHFITVAAVMNADKVIVQSENMRQAYINIMTKHAGEETREYWENKISGEGSPKFDKIENTTKENIEIPAEWDKLIRKPDGSMKKVILYNTGVQALLDNDMKMMDKIEDVLRIFKENRDDVTLLWRPHPLIKATISSMKPHLWERYSVIVERYRSEGWGIYDDSPDLDRAIIISDAYYGDGSSVVELYKKTKKPIMIQNADVIEEAG